MACSVHLRALLLAALTALAAGGPASAQTPLSSGHPGALQPASAGAASNHRLILKDGSYQIVRRFEIVGDRVRYISVERGGEWEEMPVDLVDWDATRQWEQHRAGQGADQPSPAMKEAEEIDKEEAAERADQSARMPTVATGLELPDQDGLFVLDTFRSAPELVELIPSELEVNAKSRHGLRILNPMAGARAGLELDGPHARVHLHVNDPVFYLSLDSVDESLPHLTHSLTVKTRNAAQAANGKHGAHSVSSGFAMVRVNERRAVRLVGPIHVSSSGAAASDENVIPAHVEVMPGKRWLKLTPLRPLLTGEYVLVEILSPSSIGQSVWDFRVDPGMGDNPGSIGPIRKP